MRTITAVLAMLALSPGAMAEEPDRGRELLAHATRCEEIRAERYPYIDYLCAFASSFNTNWFVLGGDGLYSIQGGPDGGGTLYDFKISADRRFMVVIYGEEGHPSLHYYDIRQWDLKRPPELIWGMGVYPGGIGHDGWHGQDLIVESDHDLLAKDRPFLGEGLERYRRYRITPTGEIRRAD